MSNLHAMIEHVARFSKVQKTHRSRAFKIMTKCASAINSLGPGAIFVVLFPAIFATLVQSAFILLMGFAAGIAMLILRFAPYMIYGSQFEVEGDYYQRERRKVIPQKRILNVLQHFPSDTDTQQEMVRRLAEIALEEDIPQIWVDALEDKFEAYKKQLKEEHDRKDVQQQIKDLQTANQQAFTDVVRIEHHAENIEAHGDAQTIKRSVNQL